MGFDNYKRKPNRTHHQINGCEEYGKFSSEIVDNFICEGEKQ